MTDERKQLVIRLQMRGGNNVMQLMSRPITIAPEVHNEPIALSIEEWLLDKYALTQSKCTETTYRDIVISLRTYLRERGLDLDSSANEIASIIQLWASLRASG
ncbi:MAG TPA: hypothetical protein VKU38_07465, partial [Ktedonobacteraceae bacterium]|nr:hypothetical protein [Ktedonobacteraceae bacterium]